jgi:hypothetical protein
MATQPDSEFEFENLPTLFGVTMPGKRARRRHDRRAKAPKPDKPLMLFFTQPQLVALRDEVARALRVAARYEKKTRGGT